MSKKKRKKTTHLSAKEIAIVKSMTKKGATMRKIAAHLGRAPSTIWRWQQR
jgi:IS30 family transposase